MKLLILLKKGQKKTLVVESIIILFLFISSLFLLSFFISNYYSKWSNLVLPQNEVDLEVLVEQNFSNYLDSHSSFTENFKDYNYHSMGFLPKTFLNLNSSDTNYTNYNLILLNSNLLTALNLTLDNNEAIILHQSNYEFELGDLSIEWGDTSYNESISLVDSVNETVFLDIMNFGDLIINRKILNLNILVSENSFFNFATTVGYSTLLSFASNETTSHYTFLKWNKNYTINYLPQKVQKLHGQWISYLKSEFFIFYSFFNENIYLTISLTFNDIFSEKIAAFRIEMNTTFLNTSLLVLVITGIFLFSTYLFLKNNQKELKKILNIFRDRGAGYSQLVKRIVSIQISVSMISLVISFFITFIVLFLNGTSKWIFSRILMSAGLCTLLVCVIIFQYSLTSAIRYKDISSTKTERKYSKSRKISILIQATTMVLVVVAITLFWTLNKITLQIQYLSIGWIWTISIGFFIFFTLLVFSPKLILVAMRKVLNRILSILTSLHLFISRLFISLYRTKKQLWSLYFYLIFFTSLLSSSFITLQQHKNQFYLSQKLLDVSILVDPVSIPDIIHEYGGSEYIVSYMNSVFSGQIFEYYIYIANPSKFYEKTIFTNDYFQELSNYEVFEQLNSSMDKVIVSSQIMQINHFSISDNVSIPKFLLNGSIFYNQKNLIDYTTYLPFYSNLIGDSWYIMKFDDDNTTRFQSAIFSFRESTVNVSDFYSYLEEKEIVNQVLHDTDNSNLDTYTNEALLQSLKISSVFLNVVIPIILTLILIDIRQEAKKQLDSLRMRGMKTPSYTSSLSLWFMSHTLLTSFFAVVLVVLGLQIILSIYNVSNNFPINLKVSWLSFISPIFLILLGLLQSVESFLQVKSLGKLKNKNQNNKSEKNE
ncbi:MAG: hypothetical protein KGD64_00600 [Candidatus Heimdallarchaeota archaeon]|nr:hypothetical protein [Candidatus Heimdallarchaeota archaeon]